MAGETEDGKLCDEGCDEMFDDSANESEGKRVLEGNGEMLGFLALAVTEAEGEEGKAEAEEEETKLIIDSSLRSGDGDVNERNICSFCGG